MQKRCVGCNNNIYIALRNDVFFYLLSTGQEYILIYDLYSIANCWWIDEHREYFLGGFIISVLPFDQTYPINILA